MNENNFILFKWDRLPRLKQMAELWEAPISAALYLSAKPENYEAEMIKTLEYLYSSPAIRRYVDIHLVLDDGVNLFLNNIIEIMKNNHLNCIRLIFLIGLIDLSL